MKPLYETITRPRLRGLFLFAAVLRFAGNRRAMITAGKQKT